MKLSEELFGFQAEETVGERLHFKLYEVFLVAFATTWMWQWGLYVQSLTNVVQPLGIAEYIDVSRFFSPLALLNAALFSVCALLGLLRVAPRLGYTVAFAAFHLQYVTRFSLGEICHASNFVGMGVLALAGAMWLYPDARERRRFVFGASIFFLGLGYSSAALSKLVASGFGWADGLHLWLWIGEKSVDYYSKFGELRLNALQEAALSSRGLATVILATGLLVEAGGFLLWFRRLRVWVAILCIGMHLGIHFAMNIMFDQFIYQLVILCFPLGAFIDRGLARSGESAKRRLGGLSLRFA